MIDRLNNVNAEKVLGWGLLLGTFFLICCLALRVPAYAAVGGSYGLAVLLELLVEVSGLEE